jgi:hypothetical protein
LYSSPNIIRQIQSNRMRWAGDVARLEEEINYIRFWLERPKERDNSEHRGVDESMGSQGILGRLAGGVLSGFSWLTIGTGGGIL